MHCKCFIGIAAVVSSANGEVYGEVYGEPMKFPESDPDYRYMDVIAILVVLLTVAGTVIVKLVKRKETRCTQTQTELHTSEKASQSQCTYTSIRGVNEPRFQVLPDRSQG